MRANTKHNAAGSAGPGIVRCAHGSRRRCRIAAAFTLLELLVVAGIVAVLLALVLAMLGKARTSAGNIRCLSNLRQIGVAFTTYASDNQGRLPDPASAQMPWEAALRKYLATARVLECPADQEVFPAIGSSYDWRDTGDETTTLAGQMISGVKRQSTVLALEALPGWHARARINAVRIDGSAHTMPADECLADLQTPLRGEPSQSQERAGR
jgi:type II secretory pathway pseudopilin PulG